MNDEWTVKRPLSFKLVRSSFGEPGQVETLPSISGPEDGNWPVLQSEGHRCVIADPNERSSTYATRIAYLYSSADRRIGVDS